MTPSVRAAAVSAVSALSAVTAVTAVALAAAAGTAAAQPAPPPPPPSPADDAAQLACVQRYLDLTTLPQQALQALQDPVAFSATVAEAARRCEGVRAPAPLPAPPAP